jgi:two-component system chemotaxis response regulator CheB
MSTSAKPLRVLVVDDSAMNRRVLSGLLSALPNVQVIGTAADGDEALRVVSEKGPDLITLDLEMPRMDGFTFLRLLMASRPTPVIVISSHDGRESVFRALELGAIDFVAKPSAMLTGQTEAIRAQLDQVVALVRQLAPSGPWRKSRGTVDLGQPRAASSGVSPARAESQPAPIRRDPSRILGIAASTGGPTALMELFAPLSESSPAAIVVAQHMPERFTKSFAERLDKTSRFRVREAEHMHEILPGSAFVCPGGRCLEVQKQDDKLVVRVVYPASTDRHAPSADRLLSSLARAAGDKAIAVVLTGMGDDASKGVIDVKKAGGIVLAEAEETAVVYGMPKAAVATGCVDEVLPLPKLVQRIAELLA